MAALTIFDCDGVLVDTEGIGNRVLRDFIEELGLRLSFAEVVRRFKGRSIHEVWDEVGRELGGPLPKRVDREHRKRQLEAFRTELQALPGVREVLEAFPTPFCVASNGPHEKMRVSLGVTGLLSAFEGRMFSRTDVARPKPFPDLFEHACSEMGAAPGACIVVEDSPLGIEAARAAGMFAIGLAGTETGDRDALSAAGAKVVVDQLLDILPWVRQVQAAAGG